MGGSADDIWGVQPMNGPTGLIFAMRPQYYTDQAGAPLAIGSRPDAFYNEADTGFTGTGTHATPAGGVADLDVDGTGEPNTDGFTTGAGMSTASAEVLGAANSWPEMGFEIEKISVTAKSRALKASYSIELAQDLKQLHGISAETELATILASEIMLEINRDIWGVQPMKSCWKSTVIFGGFSR
nr:major capsid protein [Myoviridae environmental samples]